MLDEADFIARYDKHRALEMIGAQPEQLRRAFVVPEGLESERITNVVLAAMGGSALAAEFVRAWTADRLTVPWEIVRDYELPAYVDERSLVVCYSYSGSTEETVAALAEARKRGAQVVVMASGGALLETARRDGLPQLALPDEVPGRYGVLYGVRAWAGLLEAIGFASGLINDLDKTSKWVEVESQAWKPSESIPGNVAKQVAAELLGHPVVVYSGPMLAAVALKWKVDLNENAKNLAFWNWLPEMNHNEFSGWAHPREQPFKVVELTSRLDNPQVGKRLAAMNSLLSARFAPITVEVPGKTRLEQMLWAFMLGSYVSAYLGILNQVDVGTLPLVDKLKQRLT